MSPRSLSITAALVAFTLLGSQAWARQPDQETRAAMKKLSFLAGKWQGKGIYMVKGKRDTFEQTEHIYYKLGGTLLIIEGQGSQKNMESGEREVVHHALAVLSFDKQTGKYHFRSYLADGRYTEARAELVSPRELIWKMDLPKGAVMRYTIRMTKDGQWQEVGEYSRDKKSWLETLKMTLERVGGP